MAQLMVPVDGFTLRNTVTCCRAEIYDTDDSGAPIGSPMNTAQYIDRSPSKVTKDITFNFAVPTGATITSAKVYYTSVSPLFGAEVCKINGATVPYGTTNSVDVEIDSGATSITVPFEFKCNTPSHSHDGDDWSRMNSEMFDNDSVIWMKYYYYFDHESALTYSDVYLLIEYKPAIEFSGWTDDPLTAGETYVKAVHMTELQQWTAILSEYADNGTPTFTEAVPGETSLALWLSQVQEIREVLDVVNPTHEAWIDVSVNCPRADVMTQLRAIIVEAM